MLILGVESSCDETAFAVVENGRRVLSNAIASQVEMHARYGGVVPEIASRAHLEAALPLLDRALEEAGVTMREIDGVAVTQGPGLAGCLLIGLEFAKGIAFRHGKPLVAVHHIAGHLYSVFLGRERDAWGAPVSVPVGTEFEPYLALVVSGGHSSLVHVRGVSEFEVLGETMDDAVGEAYDKVAKLMGLGYPGGPVLDRLAQSGNPKRFALPRPVMRGEHFDFSFSGLKTAVARIVESTPESEQDDGFRANLAASFQAACVDVLLTKLERAVAQTGAPRVAFTGGVACNRGLREEAARRLKGTPMAFPEPEYCTDNAAMIAGLGFHLLEKRGASAFDLNAAPSLALC